MFTGIIEELGRIRSLTLSGHSGSLIIRARKVLEGTRIGDSIAVNGICLTVTAMTPDSFTADVMAETVRRSSLKNCRPGDPVNLERAMAAGGRFGGHIVSGHIDGTGSVRSCAGRKTRYGSRWRLRRSSWRLIVEKGSIAMDGVSLTVAGTGSREFQVSVIPHTGAETTLLQKKPGDPVNLETDLIGKYVQKLLGAAPNRNGKAPSSALQTGGAAGNAAAAGASAGNAPERAPGTGRGASPSGGITLDFLRECGF